MGISVNFKDYDSWTALMLAAAEGHVDIVKYLLSHGADKSIKDCTGSTAYDEAVKHEHDEIVEILK